VNLARALGYAVQACNHMAREGPREYRAAYKVAHTRIKRHQDGTLEPEPEKEYHYEWPPIIK